MKDKVDNMIEKIRKEIDYIAYSCGSCISESDWSFFEDVLQEAESRLIKIIKDSFEKKNNEY